MLQVNPNGSFNATDKEIEAALCHRGDLCNLTVAGPGWYLFDSHTVLLQQYEEGSDKYNVSVWNCSLDQTIFGGPLPFTRIDLRS